MKLPNFPADRLISKSNGELTDGFWLFLSGLGKWVRKLSSSQGISKTQANLAAYALTLTADDEGLLVEVTDYAHVLRWTGTAWQWGPGETGGGFFGVFAITPGTGWHACDGSAGVKYLKSDGTTGTVTLPNTAGTPAYARADAAYSATITAATVPTVAAPVFAGTPVTPTGTISAIAATATTAVLVTSSGAVQVAAENHTHAAPTFTGAALTPAGTNSAPAATLPGDPIAAFPAVLYFRQ